jgi:hypothetical protein
MAPRLHWSLQRFSTRRAIAPLVAGLLGLGAVLSPALAQVQAAESGGAKGAQVYCFMRTNGNNHEVSWTAAYALIKRQSASMFRTSPEHAAVMITEAVVQNPTTYPDCGRYLGDLYVRRVQAATATPEAPAAPATGSGNAGIGVQNRSDRYAN